MSQRLVLQVFEKYQKERVAFVTAVAEMATRPQVRWAGLPPGPHPLAPNSTSGLPPRQRERTKLRPRQLPERKRFI